MQDRHVYELLGFVSRITEALERIAKAQEADPIALIAKAVEEGAPEGEPFSGQLVTPTVDPSLQVRLQVEDPLADVPISERWRFAPTASERRHAAPSSTINPTDVMNQG